MQLQVQSFLRKGVFGLLNSMGIIDDVSFGARCDNLEVLKRVANILYLEPNDYKAFLQSELKKGVSYPVARSNALKTFLKREFDAKYITEVLLDSNNILAIEYLKALLCNNSLIEPHLIVRKGEDYNSLNVVDNVCSSTAIRKFLENHDIATLSTVMPTTCFERLSGQLAEGRVPMQLKHFEKEILFSLRKCTPEELFAYADVTEGLENVLKKCSNEAFELEELIESLKSKRYTRTRIQRILLHSLLGITKDEVCNYKYNPQYIRVLGYTKVGEKLLSLLHNKANIPIVTSVSKYLKTANDTR